MDPTPSFHRVSSVVGAVACCAGAARGAPAGTAALFPASMGVQGAGTHGDHPCFPGLAAPRKNRKCGEITLLILCHARKRELSVLPSELWGFQPLEKQMSPAKGTDEQFCS